MKTFKILGIVILLIIISLFVAAIFLPTEVKIEKKVEIETSLSQPFDLVNDFHSWKEWSPWLDTNELVITGEKSGVGAVMRWVDQSERVGEREITKSEAQKMIEITTRFRAEASSAIMLFDFEKLGPNKTALTLKMEMKDQFPYPFGRYIAWMIQKGADLSFQKAIDNIKNVAESMNAKPELFAHNVQEVEVPATSYLTITDSCLMKDMDQKMHELFGKLHAALEQNNVKPASADVVFWHKFNPEAYSVFECAIPLTNALEVDGFITLEMNATHACMIEYFGSYEASASAWNALDNYIAAKGFKMNSSPWEHYITGPATEADTSKWQTNIYFPVLK